jgi:hypothetical protein
VKANTFSQVSNKLAELGKTWVTTIPDDPRQCLYASGRTTTSNSTIPVDCSDDSYGILIPNFDYQPLSGKRGRTSKHDE